MPTLFVTGAASAIGRAILARLRPGWRILALAHRTPLPDLPGLERLPGSLERIGDHAAAIAAADLVLHLASVSRCRDPAGYRVNDQGTRDLVARCRPGQRVVYLSTYCAVPGAGAYGESKLAAERALEARGLDSTILRPSEVYESVAGEGIDRLVDLALRYRVVLDFRGPRPVRFGPIACGELAEVVARVVERPPPRPRATYVVTAREPVGSPEMAAALRAATGRRHPLLPVPLALLDGLARTGLPLPYVPDQPRRIMVEKPGWDETLDRDYGFAPRPFLAWLVERAVAPAA